MSTPTDIAQCSQKCFAAGSGLSLTDCQNLCSSAFQCLDAQCFLDLEKSLVDICINACNMSDKGLSVNACTSYCGKAAQCEDAQCVTNAANEAKALDVPGSSNAAVTSNSIEASTAVSVVASETAVASNSVVASSTAVVSNTAAASNTVSSGSPATTMNIGLAFFFILFSIYLINFRKNR